MFKNAYLNCKNFKNSIRTQEHAHTWRGTIWQKQPQPSGEDVFPELNTQRMVSQEQTDSSTISERSPVANLLFSHWDSLLRPQGFCGLLILLLMLALQGQRLREVVRPGSSWVKIWTQGPAPLTAWLLTLLSGSSLRTHPCRPNCDSSSQTCWWLCLCINKPKCIWK